MFSNKFLREAVKAKGYRFKRETKKTQIYYDGKRYLALSKGLTGRKEAGRILRSAGYADSERDALLGDNAQ